MMMLYWSFKKFMSYNTKEKLPRQTLLLRNPTTLKVKVLTDLRLSKNLNLYTTTKYLVHRDTFTVQP